MPQPDALTDRQAVTALALVLDHERLLPDPTRLRELGAEVSEAAADAAADPLLGPLAEASTGPVSAGDLARRTLAHLAAGRPDLVPVIDRATAMAGDPTDPASRFDPVTVGVGALVVLALQTEVTLERTTGGRWRFALHKKATRDSAVGTLLGKLISAATPS